MAFGQTVLTYYQGSGAAKLRLYRCSTPRIRQVPVMDHTGTDLKCWRHEITVVGYVQGRDATRAFSFHKVYDDSPSTEITLPSGSTPVSASLAQRQARWRLAPRGRLILQTGVTGPDEPTNNDPAGGQTLYDVTSVALAYPTADPTAIAASNANTGRLKGIDVNDGPICAECSIEHITADNIFKVRVTFIVHIVECADDGSTANRSTGVLSNRWSCTDHLDVNLRAARVYDGMLELISAQFSPHWFRSLVLPPLQAGFRRESMILAGSPDGKKLQWQVVDQAIHVAAPYPARKWSIGHTEGMLIQDGMKSMGTINIALEADSEVDKGQLIMLGLHVVSAKLLMVPLGNQPAASVLLGDITITDFTGDVNAVRISASVQRVATDKIIGIGINADSLARQIEASDFTGLPFMLGQPDYDPSRSIGARQGDRTSYEGPESLISIFRCFLQSPCADTHSTDITTNMLTTDFNPAPPAIATTTIGVITSTFTSEPQGDYSDDHTSKMYRFYQCESHYKKKTLRCAMPLAISDEGPINNPKKATTVVKIGASQCIRIVRIHSERVGKRPQFPNPEAFDNLECIDNTGMSTGTPQITMHLLSSRIVPGTKTLTSTGEKLYRATLEMRFALSRCPRPHEKLKVGMDVWSSTPKAVTNETLTNDTVATGWTSSPGTPPPGI